MLIQLGAHFELELKLSFIFLQTRSFTLYGAFPWSSDPHWSVGRNTTTGNEGEAK